MDSRNRWLTRIVIVAAVGVGWGLATVRPAAAQATLDELEKRIRQELEQQPAQERQAAEQPAAAPRREPGYLGLVADDKNDRGRGVRILEVRPGGPADKAGLKPGDLITGLGGMRLRQMSEMALILKQVRPGGSVRFEVLRDGQKQQMELTAVGRPPAEAIPAPPPDAAELPAAEPPQPIPPPVAVPAPRPLAPIDDHARLVQLQQRVEALERRVAELEAQLRKAKKP